MNCVGAGDGGRRDDLGDVEVGVRRSFAREVDGLVGLADEALNPNFFRMPKATC